MFKKIFIISLLSLNVSAAHSVIHTIIPKGKQLTAIYLASTQTYVVTDIHLSADPKFTKFDYKSIQLRADMRMVKDDDEIYEFKFYFIPDHYLIHPDTDDAEDDINEAGQAYFPNEKTFITLKGTYNHEFNYIEHDGLKERTYAKIDYNKYKNQDFVLTKDDNFNDMIILTPTHDIPIKIELFNT